MRTRLPFYLILFLFAAWFCVNFFIGQHVPINHGFGWDGARYADIALNLPAIIHGKLLSLYRAQRIFPSVAVYFLAKIFHISLQSPTSLINVFYFYNLVLLGIALYFYYKIARHLQWSFPVIVVGVAGLFCNYAILKMLPYYPVLTDYTAFTLSVAMLYFYLISNSPGLFVTTLIGGFTYPGVLVLSGLFYFMFPLHRQQTGIPVRIRFYPKLYGFMLGMITVALCIHYFKNFAPCQILTACIIPTRPWIINLVGYLATGLYIATISVMFMRVFERWGNKISLYRFLFAMGLLAVVYIIAHHIANPALNNALTPALFLSAIIRESAPYPFIFLVSHFIYYGPIILLIILLSKNILIRTREKYSPLAPLLFFFATISIGAESRQFIYALPLFVLLTCDVLNLKKISLSFSYFILILSLLISKIWLPLNIIPWDGSSDMLHFPAQLYFMSQGLYMGTTMYFVSFTCMVFCLWLTRRLLRREIKEIKNETPCI